MDEELFKVAQAYAGRFAMTPGEHLGSGIHGSVWLLLRKTKPVSALKIHRSTSGYRRERDVYFRLREIGVRTIRGLSVPELIRFDDARQALEMTIVAIPRILDFGADYLDWPPSYSDEFWVEWERKNEEQFGDDWPSVQALLSDFEDMGIYLRDPTPNNIRLR